MGKRPLFLLFLTFIHMPSFFCDKFPKVTPSWSYNINILNNRHTSDNLGIICDLPEKVACAPNSTIELWIGDTLVSDRKCETDHRTKRGGARFISVHIEKHHMLDKRILTELKCKYIVNIVNSTYTGHETYTSQEQLTIPVLHCHSESSECKEARCKANNGKQHFCLRTPHDTRQCEEAFNPAWCSADTYPWERYCPVDADGFCAAMAKNASGIWYSTTSSSNCLNESSKTPPVSFEGKPLLMGDYIVVDAEHRTLRFDCPEGSTFYDIPVGIYVDQLKPCRGHADIVFTIPNIRDRPTIDTANWKLIAFKPTIVFANFLYKAISFGNVRLSITSKGQNLNQLYCESNDFPAITFGDPKFEVNFWWTRHMSNSTRLLGNYSALSNSLIYANESDEYQCHEAIVYKSCTPYFEHTHTIHSEVFKYEYVVPPAPNGASASPTGNELLELSLVIVTSFLVICAQCL